MYVTMNPVCWDEYGNKINHLTQWDKNQRLVFEFSPVGTSISPPYVDFYNEITEDESIRVQSKIKNSKIIAEIPNSLLTEPYTIFACVRMSDNAPDRNTAVKAVSIVKIPVVASAKPSDYVSDDPHTTVTLDDVNLLARKNENHILQLENIAMPSIGDVVLNVTGVNPVTKYPGTSWQLIGGSSSNYYSWKRTA